MAPGLEEGFLQNVFCFRTIPQHAHEDSENEWRMRVEELSESLAVSGRDSSEEVDIVKFRSAHVLSQATVPAPAEPWGRG